uniref:rho guanine nucleotide exchange factor 10-like isoform X2 n=1 Tax=Myxine glutinosa TaxID=7769 RepID=UPI00358F4E49
MEEEEFPAPPPLLLLDFESGVSGSEGGADLPLPPPPPLDLDNEQGPPPSLPPRDYGETADVCPSHTDVDPSCEKGNGHIHEMHEEYQAMKAAAEEENEEETGELFDIEDDDYDIFAANNVNGSADIGQAEKTIENTDSSSTVVVPEETSSVATEPINGSNGTKRTTPADLLDASNERETDGQWEDEVIYDEVSFEPQPSIPSISGEDFIYDPVTLVGGEVESGVADISPDDCWSSSEFESYSDGSADEVDEERPGPAAALSEKLKNSKRPVQDFMRAARENTKGGLERTKAAVLKRGRSLMLKTAQMAAGQAVHGRLATSPDEDVYRDFKITEGKAVPPSLSPMPEGLNPTQMLRRCILKSIVDSEKNYVDALQRIQQFYERPMLEREQRVLSERKVRTIFFRLREILQCHRIFSMALAERVQNWDRDETIGDLFVASFSRSMVHEVYTEYVGNVSMATQILRKANVTRPNFREFLNSCKQESCDRRLLPSLLMLPIQRFPQLIMLLQDMLRHTAPRHTDRLSLQMALSELEALASQLNEHRREADRHAECRAIAGTLNDRCLAKSLQAGDSFIIRKDDVMESVLGDRGELLKNKRRRLFLLNNLLIAVTVNPRTPYDGNGVVPTGPRYVLKWSVPLLQVQVQGGEAEEEQAGRISEIPASLSQELKDIRHDSEILSQICHLVGTLKWSYPILCPMDLQACMTTLEHRLKQREAEAGEMGRSLILLQLKGRPDKHGRPTTFGAVFNAASPLVRASWLRDLYIAQLALEDDNQPAWFSALEDGNILQTSRYPLLLAHLPTFELRQHDSRPECAAYNPIGAPVLSDQQSQLSLVEGSIWVGGGSGGMGQVAVLSTNRRVPRITECFTVESPVVHMAFVGSAERMDACEPCMWLAMEDGSLAVYRCSPGHKKVHLAGFPSMGPRTIRSLRQAGGKVYAGMADGTLTVFSHPTDKEWEQSGSISLASEPISCLISVSNDLWVGCANRVLLVSMETLSMSDSFEAHSEPARVVSQMAGSGVGVWLSFSEGAVLRLFHTETQQQLQEVNLNTPIQRALPGHDSVCVTCLEVSPGLLWVGTNLGLLLTLPLPRLEGVPKLTGRGQVAYHGHSGPVSFIVTAITPQVGSPSQQRCQKTLAASSNEVRGSKDGRTSVCSQLSTESSSSSHTAEEGAPNAEPTATPQPISNVPNRHKSAAVAVVVTGGTGCRSLPRPSRLSTGEQKGESSHGKAQLLAWFMSY